MASGAESPRQKMINLMYLVFIAMLALNMSKEVLTTFGEIEEEVTKYSDILSSQNKEAVRIMGTQAKNDSTNWYEPYSTIKIIDSLANGLVSYINDSIKIDITLMEDEYDRDKTRDSIGDFESMDSSKMYDELFFDGKVFTTKGYEFLDYINAFRVGSLKAIDESNIGNNDEEIKQAWDGNKDEIISLITDKFSTDSIVNNQGNKLSWLEYNYMHFPQIASTTKLSLMQRDVHNLILKMTTDLNLILGGENLNRLKAIVQGANTFFEGDQLKGTIALGKYDPTFQANNVFIGINGNTPKEYDPQVVMENGIVILEKLNLKVGSATDRIKKIEGSIKFTREIDGEPVVIDIPIDHEFQVSPPQANVSNPMMNVVWADIPNVLNISMGSVAPNQLQVGKIGSNKGVLTKKSAGVYELKGEKGVNKKVTFLIKDKVSGTSSRVVYDVLDLPKPNADIRSKTGGRMDAKTVAGSKINVYFDDPRLKETVPLNLLSFKVKVGVGTPISVTGTSARLGQFSTRARNAIRNAGAGQLIRIYDIKANNIKVSRDKFWASANEINFIAR